MKQSFFIFVKMVSLIETQDEQSQQSSEHHIINFSIHSTCFTTGGPDGLNDIHARNLKTGKYLTLVEGESGIGNGTESTGLALTKDNKRMYVSFQGECVYEFWRLDGKAFNAAVSDTKYHTESP